MLEAIEFAAIDGPSSFYRRSRVRLKLARSPHTHDTLSTPDRILVNRFVYDNVFATACRNGWIEQTWFIVNAFSGMRHATQ